MATVTTIPVNIAADAAEHDKGYQMKAAQGSVADQAPEERRPWWQRMPGWPRVATLVRVDA